MKLVPLFLALGTIMFSGCSIDQEGSASAPIGVSNDITVDDALNAATQADQSQASSDGVRALVNNHQ